MPVAVVGVSVIVVGVFVVVVGVSVVVVGGLTLGRLIEQLVLVLV
jgi:hypothetical protein